MDYMARALELARQALGTTSPNPAVGAVIVKDGAIAGEGFTQPPGGPHAEIAALERVGERAKGAQMFVTLEPCCIFGRTPPCTQALIRAGIASVHMATLDPNPRVWGRGKKELDEAGIATH
ncbi:MAG TPA: bifunctional diaminohydroxyphosphoribosylaminopyrimidine deaminase/5-amino-6-(5-phosphoribosylamino)uracil reductase RibD, partial [Dehalococcoidia bacterium]|nr:bifunctional diaminohydroxyphosphoribosylaminopyrimidine deaminase/5-amino-6-(5-phosphoribosylamino)uracil reductase RibD [Dehalococcoidia bacterium]